MLKAALPFAWIITSKLYHFTTITEKCTNLPATSVHMLNSLLILFIHFLRCKSSHSPYKPATLIADNNLFHNAFLCLVDSDKPQITNDCHQPTKFSKFWKLFMEVIYLLLTLSIIALATTCPTSPVTNDSLSFFNQNLSVTNRIFFLWSVLLIKLPANHVFVLKTWELNSFLS